MAIQGEVQEASMRPSFGVLLIGGFWTRLRRLEADLVGGGREPVRTLYSVAGWAPKQSKLNCCVVERLLLWMVSATNANVDPASATRDLRAQSNACG